MTDTNKTVAVKLTEAVNNFGINEKKVAENLAYQHRTLQQSFTRVCVEWLKTLATMENYDARNETAVKLAKDLMQIPEAKELLDNARLPLI